MLLDNSLRDSALRHPEKEALICGSRRATYGELDASVNALANALREFGLTRQDRVVIYFDNSVETVQGIFGAMRAAGVFVPVNPQVKGDKLAFILKDCQARVLITGVRNLRGIEGEIAACPDLRDVILTDGDAAAVPGAAELTAAGKRVHSLAALLASFPTTPPANPNISLDLASLIYTSGSTGVPKGVML